MYLKHVDPGEVHQIINNFQNKTTMDSKMSALKIANDSFSFTHALSKIVNRSFSEGIIPTQFKTAKVIPIHKEGKKIRCIKL